MTQGEGLLLLLVAGASIVAAFTFHVAVHPGELHDPAYAEAFEAAADALPVLRAVRVRAPQIDAPVRLLRASDGDFTTIVDPARAERVFRYGRLLYATPDEFDRVLRSLEDGAPPDSLPDAPDIFSFFRDRRGVYSCDVVLRPGANPERILTVLPASTISGEPALRREEAERGRDVPRALLLALIASCGLLAVRRRGGIERRLLAVLLPTCVLGIAGLGIDAWSVLALALVVAAPSGGPLLCGAMCILFPSLLLRRFGIIFFLGGLVRMERLDDAGDARPRTLWISLALLMLGGGLALAGYSPGSQLSLHNEPAATLVPRSAVADVARTLREDGVTTLVGDADPVPQEPDLATRRRLTKIFHLAERLARTAPVETHAAFAEVADAAAVDSLYVPADLRARLRARDGRAALWIQEPSALWREEFTSAEAYRVRGERDLRRHARTATWAMCLCAGVMCCLRRRLAPLLGLAFGTAACAVLLVLAERAALPVAAEPVFPLVAVAAMTPAWLVVIALCGAAAGMHGTLLLPAAACALAAVLALVGNFLNRRPSR